MTLAVRSRSHECRTAKSEEWLPMTTNLPLRRVADSLSKAPATSEQHRITLQPVAKARSQVSTTVNSASLAPRPGLEWVYNHFPPKIVEQPSVSRFQAELQRLVKDRAEARCADWAQSLSPRAPLSSHPLLRYR